MNDEDGIDVPAIKPLTVFKYRSLEDTPCFRKSGMYGILGGMGLGLTHFMFTSNVGKSTKISLFSGLSVFTVYWFYCRAEQAETRFLYNRLGPELQRYMDERGTTESES